MNLQSLYGNISHFKAKGHLANIVLDMIKQMNQQVAEKKAKGEEGGDGSSSTSDVSEIDTLVLIDRTVDWISPLVRSLSHNSWLHCGLSISVTV